MLNFLPIFHADQDGTENRATEDRCLRTPLHFGVLDEVTSSMHRRVGKFSLEYYLHPLSDQILCEIATLEGSARIYWAFV